MLIINRRCISKKNQKSAFEAPTSVNGPLAAQFIWIQYIQPMHFTHEDTHHPPPPHEGRSWLHCWFSSKVESLSPVHTEILAIVMQKRVENFA